MPILAKNNQIVLVQSMVKKAPEKEVEKIVDRCKRLGLKLNIEREREENE